MTRSRCSIRPAYSAGATIDDDVVRTLLGAPRGEVQHELADSVAIGDAKGVFEIVGRLVQDGQDLRNVTAESLAHFRNLLLVKTAPGQADLVDVPDDAYETLRIQAEKFSPAELARVLALLLAAQNDMRWTTSPRLSLELALVRSTMPETDDDPSALAHAPRAPRASRQPRPRGRGADRCRRRSRVRHRRGPADDVEPIAAIDPPVPVRSVRRGESDPRTTSDRATGGAGPRSRPLGDRRRRRPKRPMNRRSRCPCRTQPTPAASTSPCCVVRGSPCSSTSPGTDR